MTTTEETAVLDLMRQEHARLQAIEAELWTRLDEAEAAMKPMKDRYDAIRSEWSKAHTQLTGLAACIAAKEPHEETRAA